MIAALREVLLGAFVLLALGGLIWNVANVIECRRYLRRRKLRLVKRPRPWIIVKVRVGRTS